VPASHSDASALRSNPIPASRARMASPGAGSPGIDQGVPRRDLRPNLPGWPHTGRVRKVAAVAPADSECPDFTKLGISSCSQLRRALPPAVAARHSSVLPGRHWPLDCPKRRMRTPTATNQTWRAAGSVSTHLLQTQRTLSSLVKGGLAKAHRSLASSSRKAQARPPSATAAAESTTGKRHTGSASTRGHRRRGL
jgi:hypothetical protein